MSVSAAGQSTTRTLFISLFLVSMILTCLVAEMMHEGSIMSWAMGEVLSLLRGDLLLFALGMLAYLLHSLMESSIPGAALKPFL